jgi:2,5-dioxopentanoate dehydrogenase
MIMTNQTINACLKKSEQAFKEYRHISGKQKATFLRAIAEEIENLGDTLINTASRESNLPTARFMGERGRTMGQLRMFADYVEEGSWVDATIDTAIPDRQPIPKVDLRKMLLPMGTVVVFGASNFPLAFSTAGGDTASALAAGCPVVVKAHPAHIETARLVASAIEKAAVRTKMPEGVFAQIEGGIDVGTYLVKHPSVKAVAFTGSYAGGKALFDIANKRKQPIPVFSEMGSINPVILFENALAQRGETLSTQLADSVTLGVGQFCTNPGLIIGIESDSFNIFLEGFKAKMQAKTAAPMLHQGIANTYKKGVEKMQNQAETDVLTVSETNNALNGHPSVGVVNGATFLKNKALHHEVFGPFSLVVKCKDKGELKRVIEKLEGQLTATLMAEPSDLKKQAALIDAVSEKCGRIIINNVPTGVEVTHAMHHGGGFPATTDSRFTSVGTSAIVRFVRPLCFQNFSNDLLPDALKEGNPLSIWRKVNGGMVK